MRLNEDIKSVTYMKTHSADLLRQVRDTQRPVVITQHGEASAVVLDVATYEALRDASLMAQLVSLADADARAGRIHDTETAFARARRRLAKQPK